MVSRFRGDDYSGCVSANFALCRHRRQNVPAIAQTVSLPSSAFILSAAHLRSSITSLFLSKQIEMGEIIFPDGIMDFARKNSTYGLHFGKNTRACGLQLLVVFSILFFTSLGGEFIPTLEGDSLLNSRLLPGGSDYKPLMPRLRHYKILKAISRK